MIVLLGILTTSVAGVISYYYWQMSYWKRRNIPEVEEGKSFFTGHFYQYFSSDPFSMKLPDYTKKYGKTYGIYQGLYKFLVTSDLNVINEVFVKQFDKFHSRAPDPISGNPDTEQMIHLLLARGTRWKRLRALAAPAFISANIKKIHNIIEDSALEMMKFLDDVADKEIDIRQYYTEYTIDIISRVSMGQTKSMMFKNPYQEMATKVINFDFSSTLSMLAHCSFIPPIFLRIAFFAGVFMPNSTVSMFLKLIDITDKAIKERVKQREEDKKRGIEKEDPADFVDMFLDARVDEIPDETGEFSKSNATVSKTLSSDEVKMQLLLFLFAGFDTTANTMSYVTYVLAKNPDKMKKLQEEIDQECIDSTIQFDTLGKLKYLDAVLKETLRIYPLAAGVNVRRCMKSTTIGDLRIEEGECVMADTWSLHFDKDIWGEDVNEFVPERWLKGVPHPTGAYLPFGAGPRICIGMRLAYVEIKTALCYILRKYDIVEGPNTGRNMLLLIAVLSTFVIGVLSYYHWHMSYWKRRNIPEVEGKSFFTGHFYQFFSSDPFTMKLRDYTKKYGKTYGIYQGFYKFLVTSDLSIINEVFVKQFENFHGRHVNPFVGNPDTSKSIHMSFARGARWKRLRMLATPAFTNANLKKIHETVQDSALEMIKLLDKVADKEINIRDYFNEFTMDIICRVSMGQTKSMMFNNTFVEMAKKFFNDDFDSTLSMLGYCSFIPTVVARTALFASALIPKSRVGMFVSFIKQIGRAVDERVKQRKEDERRGIEKGEPSDFIDMFLDAEVDEIQDEIGEFSRNNVSVSKSMTSDEIKIQLMLFLLAGYDTTANALGYTAFLLARNSDKMKKLQEEIDRECTDTTISYETLGRLKYLEAVFKETLRMYPLAANVNMRECMNSTVAGDLKIEKGEFVLCDTWTIHYDKDIWGPDADKFVPERWLNGIPHPPGAYLPWGLGPRICIGMRLAYIEEKVALCHILRKYDIVEGPNTGDELKLHGATIVHPDYVNVILKTRN
ncbi:hypothetical protein WR25_10836 [Diploscapter pachys]|uniref:Cytochrome P450 n=1 Tax=Diploscapter pachys TaxID=2018661 RepID=A0A2A2JAQ6_9BILA|nr:hypothetical protein WR25_10836 [Diploscapter pachys]